VGEQAAMQQQQQVQPDDDKKELSVAIRGPARCPNFPARRSPFPLILL
jgi:hypothetical protein